ncbi:acyltransferase family protein [Sphingomonas qilianensis]|uniref:Acyltransferase family protein n=1 Tax=Sphingomonas qilianensis TaxID=1736690 RepID=A0ABU9XP61_9SPHN
MIKYRADIDGLRTLAVLPIVMFHAGVTQIPGGFTGVDVFFVISGFLITSIIQGEMAAGRFSIATFYRRRVVRIVPALFVVLAATLIAGCLILLPGELRELGRSAAAAAGFSSNIFFWRTSNYFSGAAESKALLHTWSLGVEEQFYIFYPLLLMIVARFIPRRITAVLATLAIGSFLLGMVIEWKVPGGAFNFYMLPSRAWELALGGLIAVGGFPELRTGMARTAAASVGLASIILALFVIGPDASFPIPWAMLPALGSALLIAYAPDTAIGGLLSTRPAVAIGRISFSLYLWHWPIIVFYRLVTGAELSWQATVGLICLSLIAAFISYQWIEKPFLARFRQAPSGRTIAVGLFSLLSIVVAGLVVSFNASHIRVLPPAVQVVAGYGDYSESKAWRYQYRRGPCFAGEGLAYDAKACLRPSATGTNILVLGDSHAAQYWRAIALQLPKANVMQATASGCRPVLPVSGLERCTDMVSYALGPFLDAHKIDTVILGGRWRAEDVAAVGPTVAGVRARGIKIVVIGPTVEYHGEFSQLLARAMIRQDFAALERLRATEQRDIDRALAPVVLKAGGRYISAYDIECPGGRCVYRAPGGAPMQFDYGHLTLPGARYVIAKAGL